MTDRCAQIGRVHSGHKGKNFVQILERHCDRVDGRREHRVKRGRNVVDLRKSRMRVQNVECLEPFLPVPKRAQHGKGWRRSDTVMFVLRADHMAPSAMDEREVDTFGDVPIRRQRGLRGSAGFGRGEERIAIRLEGRDRALADLRLEPIAEPFRMRVVAVECKKPNCVTLSNNRTGALRRVGGQPCLCRLLAVGQGDPGAGFHRETRDEMLHQTGFDQRWISMQNKLPVLSDARCAEREHPENKNENRFLGAGPHLETPGLRARAFSLDVA